MQSKPSLQEGKINVEGLQYKKSSQRKPKCSLLEAEEN